MKLRGLDLFSGIGGISLALKPWVRTVAYCECEPYAQAVLLERMASGDLDSAPIWDDVRTLGPAVFDAHIDIIFGGFPCQDISVAGNGAGLEGKRSGLFFEVLRLAKEYEPSYLFLENVPAITGRGLATVAREIAALGYDLRWGVLSAFDVGAPHLRERWWCLAYAHGEHLRDEPERLSGGWTGGISPEGQAEPGNHGSKKPLAFPEREGLAEREGNRQWNPFAPASGSDWWAIEPNVGRVVDGLPYRVDRIRALGNSVVPQAGGYG